jgi:hypothetical protein
MRCRSNRAAASPTLVCLPQLLLLLLLVVHLGMHSAVLPYAAAAAFLGGRCRRWAARRK